VIGVNVRALPRTWFGAASPGLALAALLILTTTLGGCASFDPSRISVNLAPDQFTSIGW
jgi:hypothetical protein